MRVLWKNAYRMLWLVLCLCMLMTLIGCANSGSANPTGAQVQNPAYVRVLSLNVAYYDGAYTKDHLIDDPTLLTNLKYTNQEMEADYSFAERADRLLSLLQYYDPGVFFLNEFSKITEEDR